MTTISFHDQRMDMVEAQIVSRGVVDRRVHPKEERMTEPLIEPRLFRVQGWAPVADVSESDTELLVRFEVPGIEDKDLEVAVVGDALVVAGEKREEAETSGEDRHRCERRFGAFRRVIALPKTVEPDRAQAETGSGILTVRIPKKAGVKPRHIEVKPGPRAASLKAE